MTERPRALRFRERVLRLLRRGLVRPLLWLWRHRTVLPTPVVHALERLKGRIPARLVRAAVGRRRRTAPPPPPPPPQDLPSPPSGDPRLLIGPTNYAGQGWHWARAVEQHVEGSDVLSYSLDARGFGFTVDYRVAAGAFHRNVVWQQDFFAFVAEHFTHVLFEAERPLFGRLLELDAFNEARALAQAGVVVGMMGHGSDVRLPSRHAARHVWSPFGDATWEAVETLERAAEANIRRLEQFDGPVFVSTADLLDDLPFATWCPVTVDKRQWQDDSAPMERPVPVVVHAPSHSRLKGTDLIEPALHALEAEGLVKYRRVEGVPAAEMPAVYRSADIVLDQFGLGSYGVAACEALAAGKVVVGNITQEVRERVTELSGHEVPIVQATPAELDSVIRHLVNDRDQARAVGADGPRFVDAVHDGRLAARQLSAFLGAA